MPATLPRTVTVIDSEKLLAPGIEKLRAAGVDVTVLPAGTSSADAATACAGATAVLVGTTPLRAPELARMPSVRLIVRAGIGYDIIDTEAAAAHGIWVANVPDYCADEVADHTVLLLMAAARRLDEAMNLWRREGRWLVYDKLSPVYRPSGRTLGIVGMGRIGMRVATRAAAFGWRVIGADAMLPADAIRARGAEPVTLEELFTTADAVALHCPLNAETHHLVNAERLARMKPGGIIVNTSRGGLIDIAALTDAVASGHLAAAGLDVLEDEPNVDPDQPVFRHPNVLVTSHTAWYSVDARRELALLCADEAVRVIEGGEPRNPVNRPAR